jgi:uncharacterized protein YecT (DUF1311 family)
MRFGFCIYMMFLSITCLAQESPQKEHPIDIAYSKCLDNPNNQTTIGMVNCATEAKKAWEAELNKYYQLLMAKVSEEHKPKLKASQEAWKTYKQKEIGFSTQMYLGMGGTMWQIIAADAETEFIKQRALLLKSHYQTLVVDDK